MKKSKHIEGFKSWLLMMQKCPKFIIVSWENNEFAAIAHLPIMKQDEGGYWASIIRDILHKHLRSKRKQLIIQCEQVPINDLSPLLSRLYFSKPFVSRFRHGLTRTQLLHGVYEARRPRLHRLLDWTLGVLFSHDIPIEIPEFVRSMTIQSPHTIMCPMCTILTCGGHLNVGLRVAFDSFNPYATRQFPNPISTQMIFNTAPPPWSPAAAVDDDDKTSTTTIMTSSSSPAAPKKRKLLLSETSAVTGSFYELWLCSKCSNAVQQGIEDDIHIALLKSKRWPLVLAPFSTRIIRYLL